MAEIYGTVSYADMVRPREKPSDPLRARQSIDERAKRSIENGSREGLRLYGRQQSELYDREKQNQQEKQNIYKQTQKEIVDIRPLSLSDVRSLAGLSHYIDRSGDEAMKILEEQIGLESTWKILVLTTAHTSIELGK